MSHNCSMTSYLNGPWVCGSGDCNGLRPDCGARARNLHHARVVLLAERWLADQEWEQAWRGHYLLPPLTLLDSPMAQTGEVFNPVVKEVERRSMQMLHARVAERSM